MNPFDSASLSPVPQAPLPCPLPYELTWDDLRPLLPGFAEGGTGRAQAFASHEKQGLDGGSNSCIVTLRYPAGEARTRAETVFIKRITDRNRWEAGKYRFLASRGIPTPRLLGTVRKGAAEIIILEFLPKIGIDFASASEVDALLRLIARVNSIQDPPRLFEPPPPAPSVDFDRRVYAAIAELSRDRTAPVEIDVSRWFNAYQTAQNVADAMSRAINHGEFYFQHVGWSQTGADRRLVVFDLETMALRPRFTDVAAILHPLAANTGRDQRELLEIYLDALRRLNRLEINGGEAMRELRFLRIVTLCHSLPWLAGAARDAGAAQMRGALAMSLSCLRDDLETLRLL